MNSNSTNVFRVRVQVRVQKFLFFEYDFEFEFAALVGSEGTYFLSAQSVIGKIRIQRAKLPTQLKLDISNDSAGDEHKYKLCTIFHNLEVLEESVGSDVVAAILYIAGYL